MDGSSFEYHIENCSIFIIDYFCILTLSNLYDCVFPTNQFMTLIVLLAVHAVDVEMMGLVFINIGIPSC